MKKHAVLFAAFLCYAAPALAVLSEGIAAKVNDQVVTTADVQNRIQLYTAGAAPPSPEQRKAMETQVLNKLIDEALQLQEARKLGIDVNDAQVADGFAEIAKQNKLTPDQFRQRLLGSGVRIASLNEQIRADIAWSFVVKRRVRPEINITEGDIDLSLNSGSADKPHRHLAEIFLAVPSPDHENDVKDEAEKIASQIRNGASFSALAREFSQAPGAAGGGDLGWVQEGQLDPALEAALAGLKNGAISTPVRTARGWHILLVRETRTGLPKPGEKTPDEPHLTIKQILIPITSKDTQASVNAKLAKAKALKKKVTTCAAMDKKMREYPSPETRTIENIPESALPAEMLTIIKALKSGELSQPLKTPNGIVVLMHCDEEKPAAQAEADTPEAKRDAIANTLGLQRLNRMADRYLQDLRAAALIEKRL